MVQQWLWVAFEKASRKTQLPLPAWAPDFVVSKWAGIDTEPFPTIAYQRQPPGLLRGLLLVQPSHPYIDASTATWSEEAHFVREAFLGRSCDAFQVHIDAAFFFPSWEAMPQVSKRQRAHHAHNYKRVTGVPIHPRFAAGLSKIQRWSLEENSLEGSAPELLGPLCVAAAGKPDDCVQSLQSVVGEGMLAQLESFPCLFLPRVLGQMVFAGVWHDLVFRAGWAKPHFLHLLSHLPQAWVADRAEEAEAAASCTSFEKGEC